MQYDGQKHQEALMQQIILDNPYFFATTSSLPQMDSFPSGNIPPGFDSSSCRSVYVGNIHPCVTESHIVELFQRIGPLEGCKLIRKEKSSFGFVDYHDPRMAILAILFFCGVKLFGQEIKVNWAYASGQREDTSGHFNIFVGDLSPEVTDAMLYSYFKIFSSCSDAHVMWDHKSGRSRSFGFVSFRNQQDAQNAINDLNGKWIGNRQIRCNWAMKGAYEEKQTIDEQNVSSIITSGSSIINIDGCQDKLNEEAPENNPAYTTVYVGNLPHEFSHADLHRQFHHLGAGAIVEVRVQRDKGFGFVRYNTHEDAALAIQIGNGKIVGGKSMKCSWGTKPTPPGTASNPLPPPTLPVHYIPSIQGYSINDLLTYQRQIALNQMGAAGSLAGQPVLAPQPSPGIGTSGSHVVHEGYPMNSSDHQFLFYPN